ncbi:MAG: hypothetical protein H6732_20375 [Alphaproteobacteria bacterium]|nr:hypothetical protein [Alphaproteobacteria bacterium]
MRRFSLVSAFAALAAAVPAPAWATCLEFTGAETASCVPVTLPPPRFVVGQYRLEVRLEAADLITGTPPALCGAGPEWLIPVWPRDGGTAIETKLNDRVLTLLLFARGTPGAQVTLFVSEENSSPPRCAIVGIEVLTP